MSAPPTQDEFLACVLARTIKGLRNVAVGTNSPVAATAALLVEAESDGRSRASILGSRRHNPFNDGGSEIHDRAAQGRIDAFFLGGGQIDGEGNINLVGTGPYPEVNTRFPGSYGSAFLYFLIPRVILFREEHSRRVLVPKVDFISAPGTSPAAVHRTGGPHALVTRLCVMVFDRDAGGVPPAKPASGGGVGGNPGGDRLRLRHPSARAAHPPSRTRPAGVDPRSRARAGGGDLPRIRGDPDCFRLSAANGDEREPWWDHAPPSSILPETAARARSNVLMSPTPRRRQQARWQRPRPPRLGNRSRS